MPAPSCYNTLPPSKQETDPLLPTDTDTLARIIVVGTTGAGKSTLAAAVSSRLGVPHVEFDAYRHGPNWVETPNDVFRAQISEAVSAEGWVADGNYSLARDIVWPRATRHRLARLPVSGRLLAAVAAHLVARHPQNRAMEREPRGPLAPLPDRRLAVPLADQDALATPASADRSPRPAGLRPPARPPIPLPTPSRPMARSARRDLSQPPRLCASALNPLPTRPSSCPASAAP